METIEAIMEAKLGKDLYNNCDTGNLAAVLEYLSHQTSQDPSFDPPLEAIMFVAASKDHSAIVQHCLDSGGKVTDELLELILGNQPLKSYEAILTAKAIDVNYFIPWFGEIPTYVATEDNLEFVKLCFSHGADPNRNLFEGYKTALAAVAEAASVPMAALLLENGSILKGSGALAAAARAGKLDMVEFLLEKGADVDEMGIHHPSDRRCDKDEGSALHQAVRNGHVELVPFLLAKGADVNLKDVMGRMPLAFAEAKGNEKLVSLLKSHGAVE